MATILYGINKGGNNTQVTITNPSTATFANNMELKVDLAVFTNQADVLSAFDNLRGILFGTIKGSPT